MATQRPYFNTPLKQLQSLFNARRDDRTVLKVLLNELKHRSTGASIALKVKVQAALNEDSDNTSAKGVRENGESQNPPQSPPQHQTLKCRACGTNMRLPTRPETIAYSCPSCKAGFEAFFRDNVLNVTWEQPNQSPPPSQEEEMTELRARAILAVTPEASFALIKAAWRKACMQYHPDKHQGLPERLRLAAEREMKLINTAYRYLEAATASDF